MEFFWRSRLTLDYNIFVIETEAANMLTTADRITFRRYDLTRALNCAAHYAGCEVNEPTAGVVGLVWLIEQTDGLCADDLDGWDAAEWLAYTAEEAGVVLDESAAPSMVAHLTALASEVSDAA